MRIVTALVNGREQFGGEDCMDERYLIAADDKKVPGKVVCTFVRFETETFDVDAFVAKVERPDFVVLQPDRPEAAALQRLLAEK